MKTCLIINGHPENECLAHANAEALLEAAKSQGLTARIINISDYPVVDCRPGPDTSFGAAYDELSRELATTDYIAITTPMWNLGAPGMLKNFIDGVAQARVWFKYDAPSFFHKACGVPNLVGLLQTKKVLVVWTSGGPDWVYGLIGNPLTHHLKTMFKVYGAKRFESLSLGNLHGSEAEQRQLTEPFIEKLKKYKF